MRFHFNIYIIFFISIINSLNFMLQISAKNNSNTAEKANPQHQNITGIKTQINSQLNTNNSTTYDDCRILYTVIEELSILKTHEIFKDFKITSPCCNLSSKYVLCDVNNSIYEVNLEGLSSSSIKFPCSIYNLPHLEYINLSNNPMNGNLDFLIKFTNLNELNVAGYNNFKGFINNKENISLKKCYKPCNEKFQSNYIPEYWPYPCVKNCLSSVNLETLEYIDLYSSVIIKNTIKDSKNYSSKLNTMDYILLSLFIAIILFYIIYFYRYLYKEKIKNNYFKSASSFTIPAPRSQNTFINTPNTKSDSHMYHPRVESIRTQTPINSLRKRSNNNSLNSNRDSIIKSSILPSMPESNITLNRKSLETQLYNSITDTTMDETMDNHDSIHISKSLYTSSYPAYPDDYTNLSRLSVESVKGSEITPIYYQEDLDEGKSVTSSYSKKKIIGDPNSGNDYDFENDKISISSTSTHFAMSDMNDTNDINERNVLIEINIPKPAPVYNTDMNQNSIIKSNASVLRSTESFKYIKELSKDNENYYYFEDDSCLMDNKEKLISDEKKAQNSNLFNEEIINGIDMISENFKVSEVKKEKIQSIIMNDESIKSSEAYLVDSELYYDQKKLLSNAYEDNNEDGDTSNKNYNDDVRKDKNKRDCINEKDNDDDEDVLAVDMDQKPIRLNSTNCNSKINLKYSLKKNKNCLSEEYLNETNPNNEYIKVMVIENADNDSISIEDSISSKDENNSKNIPDNTSYLGIKGINKKGNEFQSHEGLKKGINRDSYNMRNYYSKRDQMTSESSIKLIDSINKSRERNLNRNTLNTLNNKRISNLLRRSFQKSEKYSISIHNLVNNEHEKENINIDNNQIINQLPPIELSNDVLNSLLNGHDDSEHTYYNRKNISETTLPKYMDNENISFNCSSHSTLSVIKRNNSSSVYDYTNNKSPYENNYRQLRKLRLSSIKRRPSIPNKNIYIKTIVDSNASINNSVNLDNDSTQSIYEEHYNVGDDVGNSDESRSPSSSSGVGSVKDELFPKSEINLYRSNSNPVPRKKIFYIHRTLSSVDYSSSRKYIMELSKKHSNKSTENSLYYEEGTINFFSPELEEQEKNRNLIPASLLNYSSDNDNILSSLSLNPSFNKGNDNTNKITFINNTINRNIKTKENK
ncbi:hypothetical protein U3516DRAFT_537047 [Neocallimastix sp. 'constans']